MAAYTLTTSPMTRVLSTTTVDTWQIPPGVLQVEVYNKTGTIELALTVGEDTAHTATPVLDGDGSDCAAPGGTCLVNIPSAADGGVLSILGSGNKYQLRAVR